MQVNARTTIFRNNIRSGSRQTGLLRRWLMNLRTRRDLAHLPPHLLEDIGMDSKQARREASKRFWQI